VWSGQVSEASSWRSGSRERKGGGGEGRREGGREGLLLLWQVLINSDAILSHLTDSPRAFR
jgi:hypothetical protein